MAFNPDIFLTQAVTGSNAEERIPHPEGQDFPGQIKDLKIDSGTNKDSGRQWAKVTAQIEALDRQALADVGLEECVVHYPFFLDLTDEGGLDMGVNRNVGLGKIRAACGMNSEDEEFSLIQLKGQRVSYSIVHKLNQNNEPRAEVSSVTAPEEE